MRPGGARGVGEHRTCEAKRYWEFTIPCADPAHRTHLIEGLHKAELANMNVDIDVDQRPASQCELARL
jgi:hypothetical protein